MLRPALFTAAALALATAAHADVYKSVDSNGQVRYSDVWSPGSTLVKGLSLKNGQLTASQDSSSGASPPPASNDRTTDPAKLAAQKSVQQDVAAAQANQCQELKDQYNKQIHARRITKPGSTADNPLYMTEEEADAERLRTKQAMDEYCAGDSGG